MALITPTIPQKSAMSEKNMHLKTALDCSSLLDFINRIVPIVFLGIYTELLDLFENSFMGYI